MHKQRYSGDTGIRSKRWWMVWRWFRKLDAIYEYRTVADVLRTASQRSWSDGRTGGVLLQHFVGLQILAVHSKVQQGNCDICGNVLDDAENIRQRRGYYVHRLCAPSKDVDPTIKRCLKAWMDGTS